MLRDFAREVYNIWVAERPNQLAAALAYYSMFSFAPIIFIAYTVAGIFIDQIAAASRFYERLENIFGAELAQLVQDSVSTLSQTTQGGSFLVSLISLIALLFAASGLFFQLQFALNTIWRVPPPKAGQTLKMVKQRAFSFVMVIGLGLILILATLLNFIISMFGQWLNELFGLGSLSQVLLTLVGTLGLFMLSFAIIYKILPDAKVTWRDVWLGSLATATLMTVAIYVLGFFFRAGSIGSAFEAAGAVALLLVGIYYGAQIFLLGAVFIRVYAHRFGSMRSKEIPA